MSWQPATTLQILQQRAAMLEQIRTFFSVRQVLEVETPALSAAANTDPQTESFTTRYSGSAVTQNHTMYLHTSPEFPMKRLLAAGSGSIYQICKVFRQGEAGRHHNPEFTMLEWYRTGFDHHCLMDEVEQLVAALSINQQITAESERLSYQQVFERHTGLDPHQASSGQLVNCARHHGLGEINGLTVHDRDSWLDLLMSHVIQPQLGQGQLTFVFDYPASQAALARINPGPPPVAERFELFLQGVELANGFHELNDATEQQHRFLQEQQRRTNAGQSIAPMDDNLLAALHHGLPDCAGVALGLDRLLMLTTGATEISQVISFPVELA